MTDSIFDLCVRDALAAGNQKDAEIAKFERDRVALVRMLGKHHRRVARERCQDRRRTPKIRP